MSSPAINSSSLRHWYRSPGVCHQQRYHRQQPFARHTAVVQQKHRPGDGPGARCGRQSLPEHPVGDRARARCIRPRQAESCCHPENARIGQPNGRRKYRLTPVSRRSSSCARARSSRSRRRKKSWSPDDEANEWFSISCPPLPGFQARAGCCATREPMQKNVARMPARQQLQQRRRVLRVRAVVKRQRNGFAAGAPTADAVAEKLPLRKRTPSPTPVPESAQSPASSHSRARRGGHDESQARQQRSARRQ